MDTGLLIKLPLTAAGAALARALAALARHLARGAALAARRLAHVLAARLARLATRLAARAALAARRRRTSTSTIVNHSLRCTVHFLYSLLRIKKPGIQKKKIFSPLPIIQGTLHKMAMTRRDRQILFFCTHGLIGKSA